MAFRAAVTSEVSWLRVRLVHKCTARVILAGRVVLVLNLVRVLGRDMHAEVRKLSRGFGAPVLECCAVVVVFSVRSALLAVVDPGCEMAVFVRGCVVESICLVSVVYPIVGVGFSYLSK